MDETVNKVNKLTLFLICNIKNKSYETWINTVYQIMLGVRMLKESVLCVVTYRGVLCILQGTAVCALSSHWLGAQIYVLVRIFHEPI